MNGVNYNDLYRFLVSVGLALIVLFVMVPWLFLREPFDLLIEADRLARLTPDAKLFLEKRRTAVFWCYDHLHYIAGGLCILGGLCGGFGLRHWWKKQREVVDAIDVMALQQMSPKQKDERRAELAREASEEVPNPSTSVVAKPNSAVTSELEQMEEAVLRRLLAVMGQESFELLVGVTVGEFEFDAILRGRREARDYIVDVKYIRRGFHSAWLRATIDSLLARTAIYQTNQRRVAMPILMIIVGPELMNAVISRIQAESALNIKHSRKKIRTFVLPEDKIDDDSYPVKPIN